MWGRWRADPNWSRLGGPEYAALALLPAAEARRVWQAAGGRKARDPRAVVRLVALFLPVALLSPAILLVGLWAGLGGLVTLAVEVVAHVVLGVFGHRHLVQALAELSRPFVRAQLLADYDAP